MKSKTEVAIVYISIPIGSLNESLGEQCSVLKSMISNYRTIFVYYTKTDQPSRTIEKHLNWGPGNDFVALGKIKPKKEDNQTYREFLKNNPVQEFLQKNDLIPKYIINFGQSTITQLKRENIIEDLIDTKKHITFDSTFRYIISNFNMYDIIETYKNQIEMTYIEWSLDCNGQTLTPDVPHIHKYYGHDIHEYDYKRSDVYTAFLLGKERPNKKKTLDFAVGFTAFNKNRINLLEDLKKSTSHIKNKKLLYHKKKPKEDTLVSFDEYNKLLEQSKYTLVLASYNNLQLSIFRVQRALHAGCVPLFMKDSSYEYLTQFDIDIELLEKLIIIPGERFKQIDFTEKQRLDILNEMYNKMFHNIDIGAFDVGPINESLFVSKNSITLDEW